MERDSLGLTADQRDMLALVSLRDGCRQHPTRDWVLVAAGGVFRCRITGPEEVSHDAATIEHAIFGAMRKAGMVR